MIDLNKEKNYKLSMTEFYQIVANSIDIANEDGFLNSYTFERSLYMFAADKVYEDVEKDFILENPLVAWNAMLADGSIEKLVNEFPQELEFLATIGAQWFKEYEDYLHSIRGCFGDIQNFMKDMNDTLVNKFDGDNAADIANVLNIANEWGLDNTVNAMINNKE